MPEKIKELPAGRDRYILTLVRTGLNRDVAYTLADDVSAMSKDTLMDKIDLQNAAIKAQSVKIDAQSAKIDAFRGTLRAIGRSLDVVTSTLIEHGKAIRSFDTRHAEALKASEARQTEALRESEARLTQAIRESEARQTKAIRESEARQTKAIGGLEARFSRLIESLVRLLWILVGAGVLGVLGAIANWVIQAFGH